LRLEVLVGQLQNSEGAALKRVAELAQENRSLKRELERDSEAYGAMNARHLEVQRELEAEVGRLRQSLSAESKEVEATSRLVRLLTEERDMVQAEVVKLHELLRKLYERRLERDRYLESLVRGWYVNFTDAECQEMAALLREPAPRGELCPKKDR